jgi:hypothetical protein
MPGRLAWRGCCQARACIAAQVGRRLPCRVKAGSLDALAVIAAELVASSTAARLSHRIRGRRKSGDRRKARIGCINAIVSYRTGRMVTPGHPEYRREHGTRAGEQSARR